MSGNSAIVQQIKSLAKEKGITLTFICKTIGQGAWYFNDVARGKTSLSENDLNTVAKLLSTTPEYLLGKTEQKEKPAGITDELWNALCKDDVKMDLAIQISQMSPEKAKRVLVLLQTAQMLPPEESNPTDTE